MMNQKDFLNFEDAFFESEIDNKTLFMQTIMKKFCEEVNLSDIYEYYILESNRFIEFNTKIFPGLNSNYLNYAHERGIPHLIVCSNFENSDEYEFSENLASIFIAMEEMGISYQRMTDIIIYSKNFSEK